MAIIITTATRGRDIITDIQTAMRSMKIGTRDGANRDNNLKATVRIQLEEALGVSFLLISSACETDFTEDVKKFDVPTLIMHGDDDQIVPIGASALLSSRIDKGASLIVYPGLPHGMCTTHKDKINADLLAFIKA